MFGYRKVKITDSTTRFATNQCVIAEITKIDVWNLTTINSNWSPGLDSILSKYIGISNDRKSLVKTTHNLYHSTIEKTFLQTSYTTKIDELNKGLIIQGTFPRILRKW